MVTKQCVKYLIRKVGLVGMAELADYDVCECVCILYVCARKNGKSIFSRENDFFIFSGIAVE